jgi:hypothetical protein
MSNHRIGSTYSREQSRDLIFFEARQSQFPQERKEPQDPPLEFFIDLGGKETSSLQHPSATASCFCASSRALDRANAKFQTGTCDALRESDRYTRTHTTLFNSSSPLPPRISA